MIEIVGRDAELGRLAAFVAAGFEPHALVLTGAPGIGKTTLWEAAIAAARERGVRVLEARPSGAEAQLSFAALIDLCEDLDTSGLPAPQRTALEVALLRRDPAGAPPPQPQAIGLGLRNALAAAGVALLIAIDDLQWLDAPSAQALAFAARRLETEPVGFLFARRDGERPALERALERRSLERVEVGPLSVGAMRVLLRGTSAPLARRIAEATLGNPLFALEVAAQGLSEGDELPLPAAVEDLLGTRVAALPATARRLLLAVALSADLHVDELEAIGRVDEALAAGLLIAAGDRVRAAHPLLAAAARARALPRERRELHGALANIVREPEQRALHLALATAQPDAALAAIVAAAAASAAARGARPEAVALAEQALRLTPRPAAAIGGRAAPGAAGGDARGTVQGPAGAADRVARGAVEGDARGPVPGPAGAADRVARGAAGGDARGPVPGPIGAADRVAPGAVGSDARPPAPAPDDVYSERLLTLAGYLETAGERRRVTALLTPELDSLPPGGPRVRAWLLLSEGGVHTRADYGSYVERALLEAGEDPGLRAHVLALKALNTVAEGVERIPEAEAWALEALPAGGEAERVALRALGWTRTLSGRPIDDLCARFDATTHLTDSPEPVAALRLAWRGEIEPARAATTAFLGLAAERGEAVAYAWLRLNLCELELRAGEWAAAERLLDEWGGSDDGQWLITPTYQRCRALLAAGRGDAEAAERHAAPALAEAQARGYSWQVLEASRALGVAALLAGDPARAAERLRFVWAYAEREGVDEPGAFPVAAELVEALLELGEEDEARAVTRRLRELSEAQRHPWGLASVLRCDGQPAGAAAAYERLGLRFDAARSLLALGRAQRRARRWRAAREALEHAASAFDALGSPGWAERARGELARVGGRRPRAAGELTQTEEQVARLAAEGRTNKEIAHALFVTVHTVEAHLSSTYAKLGLRSRAQLASQLGTGTACRWRSGIRNTDNSPPRTQ